MLSVRDVIALRFVPRLPNDELRRLATECTSLDDALVRLGHHQLDLVELAERQLQRCRELDVSILPWTDERYPPRLRDAISPPAVIFVRGILPAPSLPSIGVVGTRSCTMHYGKPVTESLVETWVARRAVIISGLAHGIDTIAHQTTVQRHGSTIAVIASGIDRITPIVAQQLADRIVAAGGCILSEHPCGVAALPPAFPARNRIIAGLSDAVVVVESKHRGGALITAEFARQQQRPVYAVPGPITSVRSQGCHALIASHSARVLTCADDVVEVPKLAADLPLSHEAVLGFESGTPQHLDDLAMAWSCSASDALRRVLDLELEGRITRLPGNRFLARIA